MKFSGKKTAKWKTLFVQIKKKFRYGKRFSIKNEIK